MIRIAIIGLLLIGKIYSSSTMAVMDEKERAPKIVVGNQVDPETGYETPPLKLFSEFTQEQQKECLKSTALNFALASSSTLEPSTESIQDFLEQLNTLVSEYDKTPQFCLSEPRPSLIIGIKKEEAQKIRKKKKSSLDSLKEKYSIDSFEVFSALDALTIHFSKPYALSVLMKEIQNHPDVEYVNNNEVYGGSPPSIQRNSKGQFVFSQGWGDCFAGCIHGRRIVLEVQEGSVVEVENRQW